MSAYKRNGFKAWVGVTAVALTLVSGLALGGDSFADISYEQIVKLINEKHVTTIEQLLPLLPEEFRSSYTLMYDSHSLQSSSYDNPRVLMFGKTAKTVGPPPIGNPPLMKL